MANITKRVNRDGSTSWRVRLMKYGQTRTATFPTKSEAQEWITKQEHELLNQKYFPERSIETSLTVNDLIDRYIKEVLPLKSKNSILRQGECQRFSDASNRLSLPFTWNLANSAIVRSTISKLRETTIDLRLKRANQCRLGV